MPPAVLLAADGVAGVESGHAVAHLGHAGVLVRRRRDDGVVRRRWRWRGNRGRRRRQIDVGSVKLDQQRDLDKR
jgi:hypothetical protein